MRCLSVVVLALMLTALPWGASTVSASPSDTEVVEVALDDLKKDLDDISESAVDLLDQGEEAFKKKMDIFRDEANQKVDDLEKRFGKLSDESEEKLTEIVEDLKEKNKEMMEKAKKLAHEAHREFMGQLDETMDSLDQKLEVLREKSKSMSAEAQEKLARELVLLKEKNQEVVAKLKGLQKMGAASWKEIKVLVLDLWQDLKQTYERELDKK